MTGAGSLLTAAAAAIYAVILAPVLVVVLKLVRTLAPSSPVNTIIAAAP